MQLKTIHISSDAKSKQMCHMHVTLTKMSTSKCELLYFVSVCSFISYILVLYELSGWWLRFGNIIRVSPNEKICILSYSYITESSAKTLTYIFQKKSKCKPYAPTQTLKITPTKQTCTSKWKSSRYVTQVAVKNVTWKNL